MAGDLRVRDVTHQAIGSQQQAVIRQQLRGKKIRDHLRAHAHGACDGGRQGALRRLFGCHQAQPYLLLHQGVILRDLGAGHPAQQVCPAVAHVGDHGAAPFKADRNQGSAHSRQRSLVPASVVDDRMGLPHSVVQRILRGQRGIGAAHPRITQESLSHAQVACHLARGTASHAIGDDIHAKRFIQPEAVFVVCTSAADVAAARGPIHTAHQSLSSGRVDQHHTLRK